MMRRMSCIAAALALGSYPLPTVQAAPIPGTGTPAVQSDSDPAEPDKGFYASVTDISPTTIGQNLGSTPVQLDVMFTDMRHLEIFDSDTGDFGGMEAGFDELAMDISVSNTSSTDASNVDITLDFLDMNGNVITPAALDADVFGNHVSFTIDPDSGLLGFGRLFRAELMSGLQFHGYRVSLTGGSQLLWNSLSSIEIRKIDTTSNVGVWVPEPTTSSLWLLAAVVLSVRRNPKAPL